jgi:hypothetical protein
MSPSFRVAVIWILGALVMVLLALMPLSASYLNGEYVPSNADAFYHARRALDVAMTGQPVLQFDPRIHVPEGSWINWPWAYDSVLGWITRAFGPFASEAQANRVLLRIPVACAPLFIAIVLGIARVLRFSTTSTVLLVLGMAALPINYISFTVGNVDHHFAEGMWTALSLLAGMWFFAMPQRVWPGIVLGVVLATAIGVHNSLFILQLPVAMLFLLRWLRQQPVPETRPCIAFAASLLLVTLAISAPSQPWQRGFFEFYTLSWFHTYIAFCTGLFCVLMSWLRRTTTTIGFLTAAAILAILPIWNAIDMAQTFIRGQTDVLGIVLEVKSPYALAQMHGWWRFTSAHFSLLIWLSLPATLFSLALVWRSSEARVQFFALGAALGLALMQFQYRFHVFGELALVAIPLLAIHFAQQRWPQWTSRLAIGACAALLLFYMPTTQKWALHWEPAGHVAYQEVATAFPVLRDACARRPGTVLAELDAGHWVSYHTTCGVIGDVFLLTAQHARKANEVRALMRETPEQVLAAPENIRYVLVFHGVKVGRGAREPNLESLRSRMQPLESGLLGDVDRIPSQYRILWQRLTPAGQVYARLFEIVR